MKACEQKVAGGYEDEKTKAVQNERPLL